MRIFVSVKLLRQILIPISFIYGQIMRFRNKCYDKGIKISTTFALPNIVVGNLNVGGTGKTPHVEYLINLLKEHYKIAVLSRGYKRKSKGFLLANKHTTINLIGDEPMQYHLKFKSVMVAVDNNRLNGFNQLKKLKNKPEVVLLDDAFQHRQIKAPINILLTAYNNLYIDDQMLPSGNLRELPSNAKRASHIIVTKCPKHLSPNEMNSISKRIHPNVNQKLFFTSINYQTHIFNNKAQIAVNILQQYKIVLVTGIENPEPLKQFLLIQNIDFVHLKYADHHNFTEKDKTKINNKLKEFNTSKALILTTEKDYVRSFYGAEKVFYLPIEVVFLKNSKEFNQEILDYVGQSSRNS